MIQHHISVNHESSYLRVMQSDMKRVLFCRQILFVRVLKIFLFQAHGKPFRKERRPPWPGGCYTKGLPTTIFVPVPRTGQTQRVLFKTQKHVIFFSCTFSRPTYNLSHSQKKKKFPTHFSFFITHITHHERINFSRRIRYQIETINFNITKTIGRVR